MKTKGDFSLAICALGLKFISGADTGIQTELNVASDFYNPAFMMLSHDHRNT